MYVDMCRVESSNLFVKYEAEGNPFDEDLYIKVCVRMG